MNTELIWIASYPRSGNTLFRLALEELYGQVTYACYEENFNLRFVTEPRQLRLDQFTAIGGPIFAKTHEWYHAETPTRAIYIVRDGRDALVSHAHYLREMEGNTTPFNQLVQSLIEMPTNNNWSAHVDAWTRRKAQTVLIQFEELLKDPAGQAKRALEELELDLKALPERKLPTFEELHRIKPEFYRRGVAGAWKSELPDGFKELFWNHHRKTMEQLGYR